ncbi:MAG: TSUP family transporter, partial [Oscillospiraceae bacterium]|nr:TSUP family transporter [Oscillospiraceae bacterium]
MGVQVTWYMYLIVCPLCFLAGFVDAVAGGGGLISIPAYVFTGLPPHLAMGTNKLSAAVGTTAAALRYLAGRRVALPAGLAAVALALPGSWLGTMLLNRMGDTQVLRMLVLVIPVAAGAMLFRRGALTPACRLPVGAVLPLCALIGLVIGFYDGLVGPGTGTFLILAFTLVVGMDAVQASGSAKIVNLASNLAALVTQLAAGNVLFLLGLPAAA